MINRQQIGQNFYNMVLDMGENYTISTADGKEWTGKMSIVAKTASSYMMAEREYLENGVATFPDVYAQRTFRGCYFVRESDPTKKYIMISVIPKDTTPYVAEVYVTGCNAKVSLAYFRQSKNEKGNIVITPEIYAENVDVYMDSTLQKQQRSSDGNFDQTIYYMQIPAKYCVSQDEIVIAKTPRYNEKDKTHEWVTTNFRVEAIDTSMSSIDENGDVYGILDVQMTIDTR